MKCFMPVYALALALAVTSDMVQQVSATACLDTDVCASNSCTVGDPKTTAVALTRPAVGTLAACPPNAFAYIKSLAIVPDLTTDAVTTISDVKVTFTTDGTAVGASSTVATKDPAACENTYADIGLKATADVQASIGCASTVANCKFKYKVTWACQTAPASCATTCTDPACKAVTIPVATPLVLTRPSGETACTSGKFAYIESLQVGVTGSTAGDKFTVAFTNGPTTALTGTSVAKDMSVCASKWANVGKTESSDATGVQAKITCTDTAAACTVTHKAVWACQVAASGGSTAGTPAATTANTTNTTTVTPTPTPTTTTKSGVAALAGANPVVVWGTALVAAVAGAIFAAPL